jgi:DHA1 family tetracycline resistance protein-like MFS transporter
MTAPNWGGTVEAPAPGEATPKTPRIGTRRAWLLLLSLIFLNGIGMTIVFPVLPFIVRQFTANDSALALWVGLLEAVYAFCSFLVGPFLGALSDRIGRRPVIIISVFGSAIGYVLFGIGGALWVLILARVIQGLTAGDMAALFGYTADITPPEDRAKRFGFLGALSGVAIMIGPAVGGFLGRIDADLPVFAAAGVSALIGLISLVALPESLAPKDRAKQFRVADLHPSKVIKGIMNRPRLRPLVIGMALATLPFMLFTSNISVLGLDIVNWGPTEMGLLLSAVGVLDVIVQGGLLGFLIRRLGESGVVVASLLGQMIGLTVLAIAATFLQTPWLLVVGSLLLSCTQGAMTATMDGLMSRSVGPDEQGWLAGGMNSVLGICQMTGPILAGWLYGFTPSFPYWLGAVLIGCAAVFLRRTLTTIDAKVELGAKLVW